MFDNISCAVSCFCSVLFTCDFGSSYVKNDSVQYPNYGNLFGELIINDCNVDANLFFGDNDVALRNGVGIYAGSFVPGYGGTILVAGHNNTYFNGLKNAEVGQKVEIKTSYGNYIYEITDTAVKKATDRTAYDLSADYENLIMYTCYRSYNTEIFCVCKVSVGYSD